jgi:hypothetical protein
VVLIQIAVATLLLLGSALIFHALVALDLADRPTRAGGPRLVRRLRHEATRDEANLPRAA